MAAATARTYVDFVPPHSEKEEPGMAALRVDLSAEGFRKEQIRVQIDNSGNLRITGERPLGADRSRWRRFRKRFQVPDTCDAAAIRARLDKDGILLITMPKLSAAATAEHEQPKAAAGANTGAEAARHDQTGHTGAHQAAGVPPPAPAAEVEEEGDNKDARGAASSMERPDQDEQHTANNAVAPSDARPAAYGFAKDRRRMAWAIFAVVLALLGAGLYARYRLMDPSAETAPPGHQIVSLGDS